MTKGLSRSGFDIDLREGEAREAALVRAMASVGHLVEHKRDHKAHDSGNVFIEYQQKGRPSGINVTTAQWWAIEFDANAWIVIETDRLRWLCRQAWRNPANRKSGGDNNNYRGVTVPVRDLVRMDYLAVVELSPDAPPPPSQPKLSRAPATKPPMDDDDADLDAAWERALGRLESVA